MRWRSLVWSRVNVRTVSPLQSMMRKRQVTRCPDGSVPERGSSVRPPAFERVPSAPLTIGAIDAPLSACPAVLIDSPAIAAPSPAVAIRRQSWKGGVASVALPTAAAPPPMTARPRAKEARRVAVFMAIQFVVLLGYPTGVSGARLHDTPLGYSVICTTQPSTEDAA